MRQASKPATDVVPEDPRGDQAGRVGGRVAWRGRRGWGGGEGQERNTCPLTQEYPEVGGESVLGTQQVVRVQGRGWGRRRTGGRRRSAVRPA